MIANTMQGGRELDEGRLQFSAREHAMIPKS